MRTLGPGHMLVFYRGEHCLGSAKVLRPGPSKYTMNYQQYKTTSKQDNDKGTGGPSKSSLKGLFEKLL